MPARHLLAWAAALTVLPATAQAHHSFAAFLDPDKSVTVTGTVTEFRFTNPHGMVAIDVKKSDGTIEKWRAETNAPVVLVRRGWTRDAVKPGDVVTIDGWPSRDGKPYIRLRRAVHEDGRLIGTAPFGEGDQS